MNAHRPLQSAPSDAQQSERHSHVSDQRVYLTSAQAVEYLALPSLNALKQRMKRGTIPAWTWTRMGGTLRFLRVALDQWLEEKFRAAEPLRHGPLGW